MENIQNGITIEVLVLTGNEIANSNNVGIINYTSLLVTIQFCIGFCYPSYLELSECLRHK